MLAAKPKQSLDLAAIFDGHIEKEFEQNKEGGMTDRKTIDSHLAETVGPNHEDEIAPGTQKTRESRRNYIAPLVVGTWRPCVR